MGVVAAIEFIASVSTVVVVVTSPGRHYAATVVALEIMRRTSSIRTGRRFVRHIATVVIAIATIRTRNAASTVALKLIGSTRTVRTSDLIRIVKAVVVSVTSVPIWDTVSIPAGKLVRIAGDISAAGVACAVSGQDKARSAGARPVRVLDQEVRTVTSEIGRN